MEKKFFHQQNSVQSIKMNFKSSISVLFFLFVILFSGCKSSTDSLFRNTISLKGRMLSVGENLGNAHSLEAVDGYLILADNHQNTLFTILKPDGSYCFHFGRVGQGPNEMKQLSGSMMIRDRHLTLSDSYKLFRHELDSLCLSVDHPISTPNFEKSDRMIWVSNLTDSLFVATGVFPTGRRFKVFNWTGDIHTYTGEYPLEEEIDLPFYVIGASFMSITASHPVSNRLAVGTQYGGVLDIMEWDTTDNSLSRVGGISQHTPKVTSKNIQGTPNFRPNEKTRWGYVRMDSDSDYIYGLYSGRFQQDGIPFYMGNTVHVVDWNGFPVCQIKLDKDVLDIAVTKNKLYALYEDADIGFEVIEYVLPDNWMKK